MILFLLNDFGEYRGMESLLSIKDVKIFTPEKSLIRNEIEQKYGNILLDSIPRSGIDIIISGMVKEWQANIARRKDIYSIGYYDFPFYQRERTHSSFIDDFNEIWTVNKETKRAVEIFNKNVYVVGNDFFSQLFDIDIGIKTPIWLGQYGKEYEKTFESFIENFNSSVDVVPHPSTDGSFEKELLGNRGYVLDVNWKTLIRIYNKFVTWDSTSIMLAANNGKVCFAYERDQEEYDNAMIKNGIAYPIFPDDVFNILFDDFEPLHKRASICYPVKISALTRIKNILEGSIGTESD